MVLIDQMSNGDRSKWDYFLNMELTEFLNTVCFFKDKGEKIEEEQRQWQRKHNLK